MWFCKFNDSPQFPDLFVKEVGGLTLLAQNGLFRIPAVVAAARFERYQTLVLEWIGQGTPGPAFWTLFDRGLLTDAVIARFQRLYLRLPELFPSEPPALLHGD